MNSVSLTFPVSSSSFYIIWTLWGELVVSSVFEDLLKFIEFPGHACCINNGFLIKNYFVIKLVQLSKDKEQIYLPIRIHKKYPFRTSDVERRSRILALKSSQASFQWKKEGRIAAFPYWKSFVCATLTKPQKDLNCRTSNVHWWKYLDIYTTSTSVCIGKTSGAVCEQVCIVGTKKKTHNWSSTSFCSSFLRLQSLCSSYWYMIL